jgi:hypothetical protein
LETITKLARLRIVLRFAAPHRNPFLALSWTGSEFARDFEVTIARYISGGEIDVHVSCPTPEEGLFS